MTLPGLLVLAGAIVLITGPGWFAAEVTVGAVLLAVLLVYFVVALLGIAIALREKEKIEKRIRSRF